MSNTKTRKLTIVRTPTHPLRLEPGEAVHVGVDVQKATSSVALSSDGRGLLATWVQPARPEVLIERLSPVREGKPQLAGVPCLPPNQLSPQPLKLAARYPPTF